MTKRFIRTKEDFICENCGYSVKGTGYTNHCPKCLWSKHVDINPGDRAHTCQGMMRPIEVHIVGQDIHIVHQCIKCGFKKRNIRQDEDDFDEILKIIKYNLLNIDV